MLVSSFPITELRFSIPYYILYKNIDWTIAASYSIIGNIMVGLIVISVIGPIMNYFKNNSILSRPINYILNRTASKSKIINNFKFMGLIMFIGIPLPFTGVWTGALAAYIFSISNKRAIIGIIFGVLISSIIVTSLTLIGNEIWINFLEGELNKKLGIVK